MASKPYTIRFRAVNRDIFLAIKSGKKKIETRAATERYRDIKAGDVLVLVCAKQKIKKQVKKVEHFKSLGAILKRYSPVTINPKTHTVKEAREMWYSFPGYKEKIRKFGLIAITLK